MRWLSDSDWFGTQGGVTHIGLLVHLKPTDKRRNLYGILTVAQVIAAKGISNVDPLTKYGSWRHTAWSGNQKHNYRVTL